MKLDIGAGDSPKGPEYTSVDLYVGADIEAPMWEIPLPDGSVEEIYSSNALEHVSKFKVIPTIREWHRLLQVGGLLYLVVPDLKWAVKFWLEIAEMDSSEATTWPMDIIFGHQKHEGEYHKTGFTEKILWDYFCVANPGQWFIEYMHTDTGRKELAELPDGNTFYKNVLQASIFVVARRTS
jgi:predicted SAM-dependent methyltransferase